MKNNSRDRIYIPRSLEGKLTKLASVPKVIVIIGARQVGKTTLMNHLYEGLPGPKAFLDFEDPELVALFEEDIEAFAQLYVKGKQ
jgi:predicted AAA+ superfamily ATPase